MSEETQVKPKPMVEISGRPILWYIMKLYSHYGLNEFIICLGYKGYVIKQYFADYFLYNSDLEIDLADNSLTFLNTPSENWKVTLVDTGEKTLTAGRIKRILPYIPDDEFMLTYGDGIADVNIGQLRSFHQAHKKLVTVTSVRPEGRFGALTIGSHNRVHSFVEKPKGGNHWVNAGFFVCNKRIADYIEGDHQMWEREPLETIAAQDELVTYQHHGFWQPVDTLSEKRRLEKRAQEGNAPWKDFTGQ